MNRQTEGERGANKSYAKNEGIALFSYLIDCVRRGSCSDIEAVLSDPKQSDLTQLIIDNDLSFAHNVFRFLLTQIVRTAMDGGMPWMAAVEIYYNYSKKAKQARLVPALLDLCKQALLDFANHVAREKGDYQFSPLVHKCRSYIIKHLYQPLSVYHIAKVLHISRSHLSHVYKQETGETISGFIQHKKVSEAKMLLQYTSLSLADIGHKLGYCSQSHFTDIFRKETGMTPRQFRKKYIRLDLVRHNPCHSASSENQRDSGLPLRIRSIKRDPFVEEAPAERHPGL